MASAVNVLPRVRSQGRRKCTNMIATVSVVIAKIYYLYTVLKLLLTWPALIRKTGIISRIVKKRVCSEMR